MTASPIVTDPTLEEKVRSWRLMLFGDESNTPSIENVVSVDLIEYHVVNLIRDVVAANTERCAKIEPQDVPCSFCQAKVGVPCWIVGKNRPSGGTHRTRFAAAIRRAPKPSAEDSDD